MNRRAEIDLENSENSDRKGGDCVYETVNMQLN